MTLKLFLELSKKCGVVPRGSYECMITPLHDFQTCYKPLYQKTWIQLDTLELDSTKVYKIVCPTVVDLVEVQKKAFDLGYRHTSDWYVDKHILSYWMGYPPYVVYFKGPGGDQVHGRPYKTIEVSSLDL